MNYQPLTLKVWGEFACFTRPEMKAERVSYSVMTPSAARGILEAIFWKPEFTWVVKSVSVLNPIKFYSIIRNEVSNKMSPRSSASTGGHYFAEEDRTQRHTLALRDVSYIITADISVNDHCDDDPAKFRDQFRRRVKKGKYFHHPYFGNREFPAKFSLPDGSEKPLDLNDDLGRMLLDIRYEPNKTGRGIPIFFDAKLNNGILHIPPMPEPESEEVKI
jgi:CRISPR-associated protein Cas5d